MQANEGQNSAQQELRQGPRQIASWASLGGFLLIGAGVAALGFLAQHAPASGAGAGAQAGTDFASHGKAIQIYISVGLMDWALLYYCWSAVHHRGGDLGTLSGGRWTAWRQAVVDLCVALPFWVLWEAAAYGVHWALATGAVGASAVKTVDSLLPQTPLEVVVWIGASITAGVCEELAFRGFLQRQIHALSGSMPVAVLAQGLVFGLFHAYQGWRNVVVISVLGILYGGLAAWRGNLRANIVSHAWADVWEGWLKFVVWR